MHLQTLRQQLQFGIFTYLIIIIIIIILDLITDCNKAKVPVLRLIAVKDGLASQK